MTSENIIPGPLNCPSWACIILPCLNHIPSMKLFKQIRPRDADVWKNKRWVCYDASSLRVGDVIRLTENDIVPADCRIIQMGTEYSDDEQHDLDSTTRDLLLELIVDFSHVTGRPKPQTIGMNADGTIDAPDVYAGSMILQGDAIAVVTAIGKQTLLAKLIQQKKWPPSKEYEAISTMDDNDNHVIELT